MTLRLALELPYPEAQNRADMIELARAAEGSGFDSIWASELYSYDCFTTLTHLACHTTTIKLGTNIANIYARTPALLAGTAAGLDQLSNGRFILGIGVSGPQVVEGWHGVPYDRPLQRTRETIDILRTVMAGGRLNYEGDVFNVTMGLKLINKGQRPDIPIYVAAIGPKNIELTAEKADGWLPTFYAPSHAPTIFTPHVEAGLAKAGKSKADFAVMPLVNAFVGDVATGIAASKMIAGFYIGGMGSKKQNFYNDLMKRYGYEDLAEKIRDTFLAGDKQAAVQMMPDDLIDDMSLIGDEARLRDRMQALEASGATGAIIVPFAADAAGRATVIETLAKANS